MSEDVVIVAAKRTALGSFLGSLSNLSASELGSIVIKNLMDETNISADVIDDVIMGQVLQSGNGQNPARQSMIKAGLNVSTPAMTINHVCGSGIRSVYLAMQAIKAGDAEAIIAGGQENMSSAPHVSSKSRTGTKMGDIVLKDSMVIDGLWCAFNDYHMGITAENLAEKFSLSRDEQDNFAVTSQKKAAKAIADGKFKNEITPIEIPQRKSNPIIFDTDEGVRGNATFDGLQKLRPAFKKDGTVTAGNSSTINDGAAAVIVMSKSKADALGLKPLVTIKAAAVAGVDPSIMGTGPIPSTKACLAKANWNLDEVDVIEANEAFAAQALSVSKELKFDSNKVNINGGAIALGHPIGASGTRCLVTLIHQMINQDAKKGIVTLCIGGGQGITMAVERE